MQHKSIKQRGWRVSMLMYKPLVIIGGNESEIAKLKKELMSEFEMTDMGVLSYFLGLEFKKTESGFLMHQSKYETEILKRFNMVECNSTN